jgi:redox-sensitive bicupin YhaK (pirin superfamily)
MHGQPIDEPVVGHGPFVMNTSKEIRQAFVDFHYGKMGRVPEEEAETG